MMKRRPAQRGWAPLGALIGLELATGTARAAVIEYETSLSAGHSDNITRSDLDPVEETLAGVGARFSLDQQSSRLRADVVADLSYFEYLDNVFDSELVGEAAAATSLAIVPERLEWVLNDNFGQVLSDPFAPATPDNRENINYLSTGPELTIGLGSQNRLRFGARYGLISYEDSPLDSEAVSGNFALVRLLSSASSVSLNLAGSKVEYKEAALQGDYDQRDAYVSYEASGARTRLTIDVGYTELERDIESDADSGMLLRLSATRRVSASSTVSLSGGREFSNSGGAFAAAQQQGGISLGSAAGRQTVEPFTRNYAALGWTFSRARTGVFLQGSWEDHSYESSTALDQTITGVSAQVRRDLSTSMSLVFDAQWAKGEFSQPGGYDEAGVGATFSWHLSRRTSLNATYDYITRNSDMVNGDYNENRYFISVSYGSGDPRARLAEPEFAVDERN